MDNNILDLLVIQERLKKERESEAHKERPFLQLEIEEYIEIKKEEPEVEPKRVIVIEL